MMTMPSVLMERAQDGVMAAESPDGSRPRRRSFSAGYKLSVVEEYDACVGDGDKGALLRREGLYSSHVVEWRRARDAGARTGLGRSKRSKQSGDAVALVKANRRIVRLESELAKHRLALDIAGKAYALLEMLAESATPETKPKP